MDEYKKYFDELPQHEDSWDEDSFREGFNIGRSLKSET